MELILSIFFFVLAIVLGFIEVIVAMKSDAKHSYRKGGHLDAKENSTSYFMEKSYFEPYENM